MLRPTALRAALAVLALLAPFSLPAGAAPDQQVVDAAPETLASLTFGGSRSESIVDLGLDAAGNLYVLGWTTSPDFPVLNAAQPSFGSKPTEGGLAPGDAFVTSLTPDGRTMRYSTFIGGSGNEDPAAIAVTPAGVVYVAGTTDSPDFPVTTAGGSFLGTAPRGETDGFLAALGPNGALLASGYFGGAKSDNIRALALAPDGGLVMAGETHSLDFPVLRAFQPTHGGGGADAFVAMADAGLRGLRFSSFLGGDDRDGASAALVGPDGAIYVGGGTGSRNFPVQDAFQPGLPERARMASFVAGLQADGSALRFGTYLGGAPTAESVNDLSIDTGGDLLAAIRVYQT
ncbi:MAG: hypothetical protein N2378_16345, partial [Chloroflexaceae bacterium]|nr:hypothetical protein [Chloroflexaceae bacterium]